jgi:ubiquinone/menaquinone biosynthesis C-methylase UbiE
MTVNRLQNEINHGKFLAKEGAGEIWNWETPAGKFRWKRRVMMLTSHIHKEMRVLEIGCGTGYFTKELAKTQSSVVSIDISPDLIEIAKNETKEYTNIEYSIQNAEEMEFIEESFDSIIGSSVLHHLDINKALSEIYKVLKKEGSIKFTEPNMLNPQIFLQKNIPYLKKKLGDSPDETAFIKRRLKKVLQKNGFKNIEITNFDFLHPATPKKLISLVKKLSEIFEKIPIIKEISGSLYIQAKK